MTPLKISSVIICATTPSSILSCNFFFRIGSAPFLSTPLKSTNLPALLNIKSGTFQTGAAVVAGAVWDFLADGRALFTVRELLDFEPGLDSEDLYFPVFDDSAKVDFGAGVA